VQSETELWFRNCFLYVNELVECNEYNIALDVGYSMKRKTDPLRWMDLKFGSVMPWRLMLIGDLSQGAHIYVAGNSKPIAKFPVWSAQDNSDENYCLLEEYMAEEEWPYVVVTELPNMTFGSSKILLNELDILQRKYLKTKLHIHGLYGFEQLFGYTFKSVDFNPRDDAAHGKIFFPDGLKAHVAKLNADHDEKLALCGMDADDVQDARYRCLFNIKAARRASYSYKEEKRYSTNKKDFYNLDIESEDDSFRDVVNSRIMLRNKLKVQGGDKFHCDTCTLALSCKLYRKGAVCAVPGSDGIELGNYFNTRNSETILEGLGKLMKIQADRIENAMAVEDLTGKADKEINKDLKSLFDQGTKLAKLVDPSLRGTSQTNVQVNLGSGTSAPTPRALIAEAIRELELRGVPRENITPDMIQGMFAGMIDPDQQRRAIEGVVVSDGDDL
jgi:hypothetical protein